MIFYKIGYIIGALIVFATVFIFWRLSNCNCDKSCSKCLKHAAVTVDPATNREVCRECLHEK